MTDSVVKNIRVRPQAVAKLARLLAEWKRRGAKITETEAISAGVMLWIEADAATQLSSVRAARNLDLDAAADDTEAVERATADHDVAAAARPVSKGRNQARR